MTLPTADYGEKSMLGGTASERAALVLLLLCFVRAFVCADVQFGVFRVYRLTDNQWIIW